MPTGNPELPLRKHASPHRELARRYKNHFAHKDYRVAAVGSFLLFLASIFASLMAGHFATIVASNPVTDAVLSNTPVFPVGPLFVYGTFLFVAMIASLAFAHPRRIPFIFLCLSLLFFIRAAFVSLTHIAAFPERAVNDVGLTFRKYFFGNDLFFSGHTATPFMMALIFWYDLRLRLIFIGWAIFFGTVVLLGHLHYSIDVASAFFITYAIYNLAEWLFPEYRALFFSDMTDAAQARK
jgi:PAP2 superfamily C-terminal